MLKLLADYPGLALLGVVLSIWLTAAVRQWGESKKRTRQEVADYIAGIKRLVLEIEAAAEEYYLLPGADPSAAKLSSDIKRKLHQVATQSQICSGHIPGCALVVLVKRYRQIVTGGEFDRRLRNQKQPGDSLFEEISAAARNVELDLDSHYKKCFQR
ncbi:MAG: hypothetical protein IPP91_18485 [Betaproteobacteria bacterium]|nr:hypothetical protein [Betaproteobacteria bacterium]